MAPNQALEKSFLESLSLQSTTKVYARGEYLIREGQVEQHAYIINSGAVRVFHVTEFEEQTIRFGYEGSIITSLSSFITGKQSEFFIEALRKTTVQLVSKKQLYETVNASPERLRQYNQLLESLVLQQMEREMDLLTDSPAKRLQRVLKRSPNLFQQVPLKYIASYLRMTPETLSRVQNS
jgi:CRP-like cAMP-binding protein